MGDIVAAAAPIAGAYFGGPAGAMIGSAIGGALSGGQQVNQANQNYQEAARMSQFRPVGITNTFGTSNFQFDPNTGQMTSAGYSLDPRLQAAQNTLMGDIPQNLQDQANIQAMGRQYMAQSPQEQAAQYMANQQALLAPSRERESANLLNQLSNTGRTGLSIAQGGGMGASNPEYQALANARAMQDLQLAANATQAGQQQYTFGQGLLSSAYDPYSAGLKAASATENLGQNAYNLSTALGGLTQKGSAAAADYLTQQQDPTSYALSQLLSNQQLMKGIGGMFSGGGQPSIGTVMPNIGSWYDSSAQSF